MLKLHFTLQLFYVAITDKKHLVKIWKWSWSFSLKYQFLPPQLWGHCHGSLLLVYIWKLKDAFCDTGKCRNIQHSSWRVGCYCINKHITKKKKTHNYSVYHPLLCSDVEPSPWRRVSRTPSCAAPSSSCPSAPPSWRSCSRSLSSTASSSWWWQSYLWEVSIAGRQFLANGKSFVQFSWVSSIDGGLLSGEHVAEAVSPLHTQ